MYKVIFFAGYREDQPVACCSASNRLSSLLGYAIARGRVQDRAGAAHAWPDSGLGQGPALPLHIDFVAAASAQATDPALRPGRWEGGEQMQLAAIALQDHFQHGCRTPQVAVDLEKFRGVQAQ